MAYSGSGSNSSIIGATPDQSSIVDAPINQEVSTAYLHYAMSVIVSRALPDVRDGLKPVHRRIMYIMHLMSLISDSFRKSARVVGDVMSKLHPHGDSSIYDAIVRMAQPFSLLLPLVNGQGNFGSIDGDPPAAMRYTEVKMHGIAKHFFTDLQKDVVDFIDNYDGTEREPTVLPAEFPNILVNGSSGVAVGMATNIPPYNLREIINACVACIDNSEITYAEIANIIKAPDFPTGGLIIGLSGCMSALRTGRGIITVRGVAEIESLSNGKSQIIVTELPYQVNKAKMVEKIASLVKEKKLFGISDIRDESDKSGIRVVIEIKKDADPEMILNNLYLKTSLQTSFGINLLVLDNSKPKLMSILDILKSFIAFREQVVVRRTQFSLARARSKIVSTIAIYVAVSNIDLIVKLIRSAESKDHAIGLLCSAKWQVGEKMSTVLLPIEKHLDFAVLKEVVLTKKQAESILEIKLYRLTIMESGKILKDLEALVYEIREYIDLLGSKEKLFALIKKEMIAIRDKFGKERKTSIVADDNFSDKCDIDFIEKEDVVVVMTHKGYIKRVSLSSYRLQNRGGKGRSGSDLKDDFVVNAFVANTHSKVLFFTDAGMVYQMMVYSIPLGSTTSKGRPIVNFINFKENEKVTSIVAMDPSTQCEDASMVFVTSKGNIRKNSIKDFESVKCNGKIAIRLSEGDSVVRVMLCSGNFQVFMSTKKGKSIRFFSNSVRLFKGRMSDGVRGIRLAEEDIVVAASVLLEDEIQSSCVLTITENGYGKRTNVAEYRITNRGGVGVQNIVTSARNGDVVSSFVVGDADGHQLILMTDQGQAIRVPVDSIRSIGRSTQGVKIFNVKKGERVVSVVKVVDDDDDENRDCED